MAFQNLGALTTTWTPPQGCTRQFALPGGLQVGYGCDSSQGYYCTGAGDPFWVTDDSSFSDNSTVTCTDTYSYSPVRDQGCQPNKGEGLLDYYSPGLVCPSGYTTACHSTYAGLHDYHFNFKIADGETAAGCCPSDLLGTQMCIYLVTSTAAYKVSCGSTGSVIETYEIPQFILQRGGGWQDTVYTLTISETPLYAPMYRLNWHSSDLPASVSNDHDTITTLQPTQAMVTQASQGISNGARIGVGVGVTVGGLTIIGLLAWLTLAIRRAKKPHLHDNPPLRPTLGMYAQDKHEMPGQQSWANELPIEHEPPRDADLQISTNNNQPCELA